MTRISRTSLKTAAIAAGLGMTALSFPTASAQTPGSIKAPTKTQPQTKTVPLAAIAVVLQSKIQGTSVLLNNYWEGTGHGCLKQTSHVQFSPALGGQKVNFNIPVFALGSIPGVGSAVTGYVFDMNAKNPTVTATPAGLKLDLRFESEKNEIKVFALSCSLDSKVPDFNINSARVQAQFNLVLSGGEITTGSVQSTFSATVYAKYVPQLVESLVSQHLKQRVQSLLNQKLNSADFRQRVKTAIRQQVLNPAGIGHILSLTVQGGNLIVTYRPS